LLVSIVILTYQRCDAAVHLLTQLAALADPDLEVILVDNGSDDGTAAIVRAQFPHVTLVALSENTGVGGRNRGLEIARGEVVVTLDDDMVDLTTDHLDHLRARFAGAPRLGAVNFKVTWPGTDRVRDWVHRRPVTFADDTFPTYEITEGAVAWRSAALRAVGLYREDFFISHEGVELAIRLLNGGWQVVYDGRVGVGHAHAAGGRTSWRRYYFDTRNMYWVAKLHMPVFRALKYLTVGTGAMGVYALRDGHFGAWLRAVRDGLAGMARLKAERRVWTPETAAAVAEADSWRPGFWTMVRKRLKQKDFSMDG